MINIGGGGGGRRILIRICGEGIMVNGCLDYK